MADGPNDVRLYSVPTDANPNDVRLGRTGSTPHTFAVDFVEVDVLGVTLGGHSAGAVAGSHRMRLFGIRRTRFR